MAAEQDESKVQMSDAGSSLFAISHQLLEEQKKSALAMIEEGEVIEGDFELDPENSTITMLYCVGDCAELPVHQQLEILERNSVFLTKSWPNISPDLRTFTEERETMRYQGNPFILVA